MAANTNLTRERAVQLVRGLPTPCLACGKVYHPCKLI